MYPKGIPVIPTRYRGNNLDFWEKIVLHTTESVRYSPNTDSYYGHQLWPHATLSHKAQWEIYNHLPLNRTSACMRNLSGGVQTNNDGCIQLEIAWTAGDGQFLPTEALDVLADWIEWVCDEVDIPKTFIDDFHFYPPENGYRLGKEPWRLRGPAWNNFRGILGHQHADENVHGDPGKINVAYLRERLQGNEEEVPQIVWFKRRSDTWPAAYFQYKQSGICKWVPSKAALDLAIKIGIVEANSKEMSLDDLWIDNTYFVDGPYKTP